MSLETGQVIEGKYRINRLLGEGGMGAVYEGENIRIQRRVAIKVLHPAYCDNKDVMARFQREAQAAGRIGNDHILEVLDLGQLPDGSNFMVLEFLDGEPLSARIQRLGRMTPQQIVPLARQMLKGLGAAHAAGIVHRDLKPDNIFILKEKAGQPDYVKIIDFGISKFQPLAGGEGMRMTTTGAVMGTPYYMSPEQASGSREADGRSDLYTCGVILYECCTGRVPFDGETFNQLMFKIVLSEPPPLLEVVPDLDPAFASVVQKAMMRDVTQRFQSAAEFAQALQDYAEKGARVSVPAPNVGTDLVPGVARSSMASVTGIGTPGQTMAGGARPVGNATGGNWATSQAGVAQQKNTVLVASIAGGVLLAAAIIGGIVVFRGGSSNAAPAGAAAPAASATPTPAPQQPAAVPAVAPAAAPAAVAPAVAPQPAPEPASDSKTSSTKSTSGSSKAKAVIAAPPPAKEAPKRPPAGGGKAKGGSSDNDFGY